MEGASLSIQCVVFQGVLTMLECYEIANCTIMQRGNILQAPVVTIGRRDIHPYLSLEIVCTHRLPG